MKKDSFHDFDSDTERQRKSNIEKTSSKGFQRLKQALQAANTTGDNESDVGAEAYLVRKIKENVEEYDLRAIVFAILYRTGFDKNELLAHQKQKIEVNLDCAGPSPKRIAQA